MKLAPFSNLLSTSIGLVFALSISTIALNANENGTLRGADFLFNDAQEVPLAFNFPENKALISQKPRVAGVSVEIATSGSPEPITLTPSISGSIRSIPGLNIFDKAPVGGLIQSSYFKTTTANRETRRGYFEFSLGTIAQDVCSASLVLTETSATLSTSQIISHILSYYPSANLSITTADYGSHQQIGTITTNTNNNTSVTVVLDHATVINPNKGGKIGFEVKLANEATLDISGSAGEQFGEFNALSSGTSSISTPATSAQCGNGIKEAGEECDDGDTNNYDDGCLSSCQLCAGPGLQPIPFGGANAQCCTGLGLYGGLCSEGSAPKLILTYCGTPGTTAQCGNGIKESGEACDDGNTNNYNDGCLDSCQLCAGPGLQANVYGGANAQCCSGLVLQGGLCNVPPTSTQPDFSITGVATSPSYTNQVVPADYVPGYIGIIGNVKYEGPETFRGLLKLNCYVNDSLVGDTNFDFRTGAGLAPNSTIGMQCDDDWSNISAGAYTLKVIVDPQNEYSESSENNNSGYSKLTVGQSTSCIGPYHVLAPDGRCVWSCSVGTTPGTAAPFECVCRPGFTETSKDQFGRRVCTEGISDHPERKVMVCHLNDRKGYEEITVDENGWKNGHAKHLGDYIKTDKPCGLAVPLPQPIKPFPTPIDDRDELISKLKARIAKLELRITNLEKQVIERERARETKVDEKLIQRFRGGFLIQPFEKGNVWYVDPGTLKKFFLKDGDGAYNVMRTLGVGISEADFTNIKNICPRIVGKIMLRVEKNGEAYYVDELCEAHYVKDGATAYNLMKEKAHGIANEIQGIPTGDLEGEIEE